MNIFRISPEATPQDRLQSEARDWLILLTSGRATVADARALRQWCAQSPEHARAFEQSKLLWQQLQPAAERLQAPRHLGRRAFLGGAMAASAAFLLIRGTVPGGFSGLGADYITEVGEQRRVDLADGVSLELNTQTRINRRDSADGARNFELVSGEVEVLTRAQAPLKVQAGAGWLSASQARFNLRNIDQNVCITCLDGTLQVDVQGHSIRLESGQQLTYDAGRVSAPQTVDTSAVIAWRQQVLVFNDATLATVIDEINRYRPGMLLLLNSELGKRKVQARFSLDQLAGVALLIRDAYGAKCTELPGGVVVLS
ncbi:iron dicitrate transport regulator FecR [Pseudomonas frederiksbergensis]|uniref:Iron dicitrate transport regulator FecR n=1 Tax=Pseudomonas frederiksbergensis TaxID=104087 RepID=A0A2S8HNF8_9PSED|nr:FecR family protein [Pseudomonas frederiksbergensis]PQP04093.1 iron dicitrate transport regulator FecR [Pseudomonas frederiksbergensis]